MNTWNWEHAIGYMSRVQDVIDASGLDEMEEYEPTIRPLRHKVVDAFQARNLTGVRKGCDEMLAAIERMKKPRENVSLVADEVQS